MIRKVFTAYEQVIRLALPEEWIGKSIELIAFALPAEAEQPARAVRKAITVIQVPQIPYRFDRDELYER
jgi:hypothetical protein